MIHRFAHEAEIINQSCAFEAALELAGIVFDDVVAGDD